MHSGVDFTGYATGESGYGFEFFEGGFEKSVRGSEVVQDFLFACGSDSGEVIKDGAGHFGGTELAMISVGEAVSLVADTL